MDNLIVSLEGSGARAIEERADREGWSRDKIQEVWTTRILLVHYLVFVVSLASLLVYIKLLLVKEC